MKTMLKLTIAIISVLIILSCNSKTNKKKDKPENQLENFDWLLGNWKRLNEETGKDTFENWVKVSPFEYSGIGFTMQNGDTIKQERIRIIQRNEKWALIVKVPEETASITFPIVEIKNDEFTCTHDSLDFPKKIKYWKKGDRINAMVAGDSLKIDFEFEPIK